jgi:hypothetical protein
LNDHASLHIVAIEEGRSRSFLLLLLLPRLSEIGDGNALLSSQGEVIDDLGLFYVVLAGAVTAFADISGD